MVYEDGASTAWSRSFHIDQSMNVSIRCKWRLVLPAPFESNEYGEARLEVDDVAHGPDGQSYLARFSGGAGFDQDSGWQEFSAIIPLSGPADHTIEIGGWNNRKSFADEFVDVYVDEVVISEADGPSSFGPPSRFPINAPEDELSTYGGVFRGRPKTFDILLSAPAEPGVHHLRVQMLQEGVAWFGPHLDLQINVLARALASDPQPPDLAVDVDPATALTWVAADGAVGHHVYFGNDVFAVAGADTNSPEFVGTLPPGSEIYDPPGLLAQAATYYWRVDEVQPAGPPHRGRLWTFTTYHIPSDFDQDRDVDQADFGHLQECLSGGGVPQSAPDCQDARLDADGDVDQSDFRIWQRCHSGADNPADPNCAD